MRGLEIRITILKILIAVVIIAGIGGVYLAGRPMVLKIVENMNRETHLAGEVYKVDELEMSREPIRYFYNRWDASSGYEGDFVHDDYHFKYGLGMYLPYNQLKSVGEIGRTEVGFRLGGEYDKVYFVACAETEWLEGDADEIGGFKLICLADGEEIFNSHYQDVTYSEEVRLNVEGVEELVIQLEVCYGPAGTPNIILGEFEASKIIDTEGN